MFSNGYSAWIPIVTSNRSPILRTQQSPGLPRHTPRQGGVDTLFVQP